MSGGEDGGGWHCSAGGEWPVGDGDSLAGGGSVGGSLSWAWNNQRGARGAHGGVGGNGCGDDGQAGGGDGHARGEGCGLGERAWAFGDCEGLGCSCGVGLAILGDGGCDRAVGCVGCDDLGGCGWEGGGSGLMGECAWAVGNCQGGCL